MKTPSILANCIKGSKTRLSMSWYRMKGTHWRGINITYEENTIIYHARAHSVAWWQLSRKKIQGSTFSVGVGLSRLRSCKRRRWKHGLVGCHEDEKAETGAIAPENLCNSSVWRNIIWRNICPRKAMVKTDLKLHAKIQNEHEAAF